MKFRLTDGPSERKHPMKQMADIDSRTVVAWLTPMDTSITLLPRATPLKLYSLTQKNKRFVPHLLVVPTGSSIDFPNEDPFFHNVFSLFNGKRFDLGLYEAGSHRSVRFDRDGVSYIFCNIHPEMGAVVISLNTPYYATSSNDGTLVLRDLQPGDYMFKVWAEGVAASDLAAFSRRVKITRDNVALGTISLVRTAKSAEHKNKFGEDYKPTSSNVY